MDHSKKLHKILFYTANIKLLTEADVRFYWVGSPHTQQKTKGMDTRNHWTITNVMDMEQVQNCHGSEASTCTVALAFQVKELPLGIEVLWLWYQGVILSTQPNMPGDSACTMLWGPWGVVDLWLAVFSFFYPVLNMNIIKTIWPICKVFAWFGLPRTGGVLGPTFVGFPGVGAAWWDGAVE